MATKEEVEKLKASWSKDPIWDIEETEGFEEHREELKFFHQEMKAKWESDRLEWERIAKKKPFAFRVEELHDDIDGCNERMGRREDRCHDGAVLDALVLQKVQALAIVLLAEQAERIASALERLGDQGGLAESV